MQALRLAVRRRTGIASATSRLNRIGGRPFSDSQLKRCPSCSTPLPTALPTCPNCSHIEPLPSTVSYFDLFGLPTSANSFRIDVKDLRNRFLQAQRVCHPDAWAGKGAKEHGIAEAQSSLLNTAYNTLTSPVLRAQYILTQHGLPPSETDKLTDETLIMQVMEAREELEEAKTAEEVETVRGRNGEMQRETVSELERLLGEERWEDANKTVVKLKYLEGIESAAKEWHGRH